MTKHKYNNSWYSVDSIPEHGHSSPPSPSLPILFLNVGSTSQFFSALILICNNACFKSAVTRAAQRRGGGGGAKGGICPGPQLKGAPHKKKREYAVLVNINSYIPSQSARFCHCRTSNFKIFPRDNTPGPPNAT